MTSSSSSTVMDTGDHARYEAHVSVMTRCDTSPSVSSGSSLRHANSGNSQLHSPPDCDLSGDSRSRSIPPQFLTVAAESADGIEEITAAHDTEETTSLSCSGYARFSSATIVRKRVIAHTRHFIPSVSDGHSACR
jgi:hypothetical protein